MRGNVLFCLLLLLLAQASAWSTPPSPADFSFDSYWELEFKLGNVREALATMLREPKPWMPGAEERIALYQKLIAELEATRGQFPPHIARQYYDQQRDTFRQLRDNARELLKETKPNTRERWIWEHKLELAEERLRYLEGNETFRGGGPPQPGVSTQSTGAAPPRSTGTPRAAPAPRLSDGVRRLLSSDEWRGVLDRISENKGAVAANLLVAAVQVVLCQQSGGSLASCLAESTAEQAAAAGAAWLTGSAAGSAIPAAVLLTYHLDAEMVRSGQNALQNARIARAIQAQQRINLRDPRLGERLQRIRAEIDKLVKLGEDIQADATDLRNKTGAIDLPELEKRLTFLRRSAAAFDRFQKQCRQAKDSRDEIDVSRGLATLLESRISENLRDAARLTAACASSPAIDAAVDIWNAAVASQKDMADARGKAAAANEEVVKSQRIVASALEQLRQVRSLAEGFNALYAPTQAGAGYQRVIEKLRQFDRERFYINSALELIALPKEGDKTYEAVREVLLDLRVRSLEPRPLTAEEEANLNLDRRVKPEDAQKANEIKANEIKDEHDRLLDQFAAAVAPCDAARPAPGTVTEIASLADRAAQLLRTSDPTARIAACRLSLTCRAEAPRIQQAAALVRQFDFPSVMGLIAQIKQGRCDVTALEAVYQAAADTDRAVRQAMQAARETCDFPPALTVVETAAQSYPESRPVRDSLAQLNAWQANSSNIAADLSRARAARDAATAKQWVDAARAIAVPPCLLSQVNAFAYLPPRSGTPKAPPAQPSPAPRQPDPPKPQPPKPGEMPEVLGQSQTPPARQEINSGAGTQGRDGEMVGTCRATILPSRKEGHAGDISEITVTIQPPWDQRIVEVNLMVLPAGRELTGVKRIGAGKFTRAVRFAGQSGPITLLFVARDAKHDVYCQGTVQLTSKGPAAK